MNRIIYNDEFREQAFALATDPNNAHLKGNQIAKRLELTMHEYDLLIGGKWWHDKKKEVATEKRVQEKLRKIRLERIKAKPATERTPAESRMIFDSFNSLNSHLKGDKSVSDEN